MEVITYGVARRKYRGGRVAKDNLAERPVPGREQGEEKRRKGEKK